jgi:hypothetical protein
VKIGPNSGWGTAGNKLLYFGDNSYVYVGEKDADDRLYLRGGSLVVDINGSKGTSGYVLTSNGTTATWAAPSGGGGTGDMLKSTYDNTGTTDIIDIENGGTGLSSYTQGDLLSYTTGGTALTKIAAGTSGYVLTSNGAGTLPTWQAASTSAGGWIDGGDEIKLITSADDVAIGTTRDADYKLNIQSDANLNGIKVSSSGTYGIYSNNTYSSTSTSWGGYFSSITGSDGIGVYGVGSNVGTYGQTSSTTGKAGYFANSGTSGNSYGIYASTASSSGYAGYFYGRVLSNSTFTGTNFILSSDKRLKANIKILRNTEWTDNLIYQSFYMKDDYTKRLRTGFIAQEVEKNIKRENHKPIQK